MEGDFVEQLVAWLPNWLLILILIAFTIVVALVVHATILRFALALWPFRHPLLNFLISRMKGISRYATVLLALSVVMPLLPLDPGATDTANRIFVAALILLLG